MNVSMRRVSAIVCLLLIWSRLFGQEPPEKSTAGASQSSAAHQHQPTRCDLKELGQCLKDVAHDQAGIWTSPLRLKGHDALWLVPFAGATGAAFAYDQDALRQVGTTNQTLIDRSEIISKFGSGYATFGEAGVLYLTGVFTHNDHLRETGVLGAEAVVDASIVAGAYKAGEQPGTPRPWRRNRRVLASWARRLHARRVFPLGSCSVLLGPGTGHLRRVSGLAHPAGRLWFRYSDQRQPHYGAPALSL